MPATPPLQPSRPSAPTVAPVEIDGVRYEQDLQAARHGGGGLGGYLVAVSPTTGERLWMLQVYEVPSVATAGVSGRGRYFRSMRPVDDGKALEIENETGARYKVDLQTRQITLISGPLPPANSPEDEDDGFVPDASPTTGAKPQFKP